MDAPELYPTLEDVANNGIYEIITRVFATDGDDYNFIIHKADGTELCRLSGALRLGLSAYA